MVKVSPLEVDDYHRVKRIGFMSGEIAVPDDFDSMEAHYITGIFEGQHS